MYGVSSLYEAREPRNVFGDPKRALEKKLVKKGRE
jgi:hypothetical protein